MGPTTSKCDCIWRWGLSENAVNMVDLDRSILKETKGQINYMQYEIQDWGKNL